MTGGADLATRACCDFLGGSDTHYGIFAGCGTTLPFDDGIDTRPLVSGGYC